MEIQGAACSWATATISTMVAYACHLSHSSHLRMALCCHSMLQRSGISCQHMLPGTAPAAWHLQPAVTNNPMMMTVAMPTMQACRMQLGIAAYANANVCKQTMSQQHYEHTSVLWNAWQRATCGTNIDSTLKVLHIATLHSTNKLDLQCTSTTHR